MLPEEIRTYLSTCSVEHADQIILTLRQVVHRDATSVQVHPPAASMRATQASTSTKIVKKHRSKKARREVEAAGPKRPLNSWMAFRSR
jgi:hypothetical protein